MFNGPINILFTATFLLSILTAQAQHEHHNHQTDTSHQQTAMTDSLHHNHHDMHDMDVPMGHAFSLNLPMNRNGSGTGWLPDASPMYGYMLHSKKWMYMIHGNIFLRYTNQDIGHKGSRGDSRIDAPNWFMLMAQRKVGPKGLFHYSAMLSLDPVTQGGSGHPLLFQSGETWKGKTLVDRQYPYDLFSGLSVSYAYAFSQKVDAFVYFGYPGEPAIGSVSFKHRPSALSNPDAPISNHWSDCSNITYGVATLGVRREKFKLEGSLFTGREPDENRYNFDKMRFDSWSGRLSYNPSSNWALQVSHGYIKSPKALHSGENVNRTIASGIFSLPLKNDNGINITAQWGLNKTAGHYGENAALLEGAWRISKTELYTRYEWVQKSVEELDLDPLVYGDRTVFPINAFTAGLSYDLLNVLKTRLAIGGQLSVFFNDPSLNNLYGKNPMALQVYLRLYPELMK